MKDWNFIFAGFGGQGILFTGKVVAYTGLLDGHEVSWLPSYGPEMRGGTANCSVCISDRPVASPLVTAPNVLLVMNGPSYDRFIGSVEPGGCVVLDSSMIKTASGRTDLTVAEIPATRLAKENGLGGGANMIMLGRVLKETGFTTLEGIRAGVEKSVPASKKHLLEANIRAIELGYGY